MRREQNLILHISARLRLLKRSMADLDELISNLETGQRAYADLRDRVEQMIGCERLKIGYLMEQPSLTEINGVRLPLDETTISEKDAKKQSQLYKAVVERFYTLNNLARKNTIRISSSLKREAKLSIESVYYRALRPSTPADYRRLAELLEMVSDNWDRLNSCAKTEQTPTTMPEVHRYVVAEDGGETSEYAPFTTIAEEVAADFEAHHSLAARIAAIERVVELRYQIEGNNTDWIFPAETDVWETRMLTADATEWQKKMLTTYSQWKYSYYASMLLSETFEAAPPAADYSRSPIANTPVSRLLADFENKQSKRVSQARAELIRRYEYLDTSQQLAFRLALLKGTSKSDKLTGCKLSMERWDGCEMPLVEEAWRWGSEQLNNDVWYWASRLLLRHADQGFVRTNQWNLTHLGVQNSSSLYYVLCLRLAGETDFQIEKSRLSIGEYYRVLYNTHAGLNQTEWIKDLYATTAELYVCSCGRWTKPRRLIKADEVFPCHPISHLRFRKESRNGRWCKLTEIKSIRNILLYGSLMGASGVEEYIDYTNVVASRLREMDNEYVRQHTTNGVFDEEAEYDKFRCMAADLLRTCCPEAHKSAFDFCPPIVEPKKDEVKREVHKTYQMTDNRAVKELKDWLDSGPETWESNEDNPF